MNDQQRIQSRIAGRKAAQEIDSLLDWSKSDDRHYKESFIEHLRESMPQDAKPVEKLEPIGRLGVTQIPFGQYKDCAFDAVPLDYLDWLCRSQEEFYKSLRAYLKHPELESRRRASA